MYQFACDQQWEKELLQIGHGGRLRASIGKQRYLETKVELEKMDLSQLYNFCMKTQYGCILLQTFWQLQDEIAYLGEILLTGNSK